MDAILHGGITTPNNRTLGYAANKSKKAVAESLSIARLATVVARRAIHLAKAAMKIANCASNIAEGAIFLAKLAKAPCESRHADTECRRSCRMDRSRKAVSRPRELQINPLAPGRPQFGGQLCGHARIGYNAGKSEVCQMIGARIGTME